MIIATPVASNASLPSGFVKSLMGVREYTHVFQEGPSIPENRNNLFERARLENESLLMIDSDMVFTPNDVKKMEMLLDEMDVVTGVAVMSWPDNPPAIFDHKLMPFKEIPDTIFEIEACGAFFLGISRKVVQTLVEPFTPLKNKKYGMFYGEDISFCKRTKQEGFKIHCDPSIQIGHIKSVTKYYGKI